jgi:lipopolysaccharide/colanic/teichoic acid biosynthesis glycosyltransferase
MVQLDLRYSENMTPLTDLSIILKTLPVVLMQVSERPSAERAE